MNTLKRPRSCTDTSTSGSALCWKHSRPLDVYCCTDEKVICEVCASAEHTGHTFGLPKEERRRKQEELSNMQTKSRRLLQKQEKKQKDMGKTLELIQEEAIKTKDYCECILVSVIDSLQRHYLSVKQLIDTQEEAAVAQVQTSIQTLQVKMKEMEKRNTELDHLAETDDVHFLQKWPSLKGLCRKDNLHPFQETSEDPLLPFELTKRAVEKLGKQLEELCDKEFASISHSVENGEQQELGGESEEDDMQQRCETSLPVADNTLTHQDVEPKTRADFLRYACGLSLDPSTAHEDLVISAEDKEVRLSPQPFRGPAFRYPEQFIHRRQVLCKEGLQAERSYYEIEVKGNKVEIALAYKGIDRKSRTTLSAFGATAKSWSLDRSTNYSVSHRAESIQLTTPPTHCRIGVYLKFKEGTLSFYEVSDSMKFLYTVEAEFTEPLYPGFWLGEKCCIKICDL
uniref:tripartite motif-containing protein 16-like n=1 Tax=Semicossyphus pulcher TaxID=241346 RepID=UPI0037E9AD03